MWQPRVSVSLLSCTRFVLRMELRAIMSYLRLSETQGSKVPIGSAMMPKNEGEVAMLVIGKEGYTSHVSPTNE